MAMSIQRTALILTISRLIVVVMVGAILSGQSFLNASGIDSVAEQQQEKSSNFKDFFFSNGINIGGTFTDTKIGDEQYGFKMSFSNVLISGATGWFPTEWGTNNFEKIFMYMLNFIGVLMSALALFEVFQIARGKTT